MTENLRKSFLELVTMATIADMMPRVDDNREMISEGLGYLRSSLRPGVKALFDFKPFKSFTLIQQVSKTNSLLNILDIENGFPVAFRLLTISDQKEAEKMVEDLYKKGQEKRKRIEEIKQEIEIRISGKEETPLIFEGGEGWQIILLGVVASILSQKYQKPVFLHKKGKEVSDGSIRAPAGYDTVEAMKNCSGNLLTYGGHPRASGFRIENKGLEKFQRCLTKYFK